MRLFWSPNSPFVRKVLIVAHEVSVLEQISLIDCSAHAIERDAAILAFNPLGQVPTLISTQGQVIADSSVICAYLDEKGTGAMLAQSPQPWVALYEQALADGMATAALAMRYEQALRPEAYRWDEWITAQQAKINTVLAYFETKVTTLSERFDVGLAALASALFYLDLRFPDLNWRQEAPGIAGWYQQIKKRESIQAVDSLQ